MDSKGRGIAEVDGRPARIAGALPGEVVSFRVRRRHRGLDEGIAVEVHHPAPDRVAAPCAHFDVCGGCSLQHLSHPQQVDTKAGWLRGYLEAFGVDPPDRFSPPIVGAPEGYRRRARLGVKHVPKKGGALVGFREKASPYLAVLSRCETLAAPVGDRIQDLRELITALEARAKIPQVEVAVGENASALVFRHLAPLTPGDRERLRGFAKAHGIQVHLQPGGPASVTPLYPVDPEPLSYTLPDERLVLRFEPTDFVQVNAAVNRRLVARVLEWLDPRPGERVLDLFCGIGNFTLPVARRGAAVVGLEGDLGLAARAGENARRNRLEVGFDVVDLDDPAQLGPRLGQGWDKLLLDPPRRGAARVVEHLSPPFPASIVYVSCHPETLARDAATLCHRHGYTLSRAGIVDMFPHTAHGEVIAKFVR